MHSCSVLCFIPLHFYLHMYSDIAENDAGNQIHHWPRLVSEANFHEDIRRTPKRSQTNAVIVAKLFHTAAIFSSIKTLNWVRSWMAIYYMRALSQWSIHKEDLHYTQTPAQFFSSVYTPGMSKCIHLCFLQWYNNHGNAVSVAKYFSHNSQLESHLRTHIGDKP